MTSTTDGRTGGWRLRISTDTNTTRTYWLARRWPTKAIHRSRRVGLGSRRPPAASDKSLPIKAMPRICLPAQAPVRCGLPERACVGYATRACERLSEATARDRRYNGSHQGHTRARAGGGGRRGRRVRRGAAAGLPPVDVHGDGQSAVPGLHQELERLRLQRQADPRFASFPFPSPCLAGSGAVDTRYIYTAPIDLAGG